MHGNIYTHYHMQREWINIGIGKKKKIVTGMTGWKLVSHIATKKKGKGKIGYVDSEILMFIIWNKMQCDIAWPYWHAYVCVLEFWNRDQDREWFCTIYESR